MQRIWILACGTAVLIGLAAAGWTATRAADKEPAADKQDAATAKDSSKPKAGREDLPLKEYMRKKLAASNQILEGLCTEDSELILQGARTLNEMSNSERWRVMNDPMYRQFSGEFREITQQLVTAAEKNNKDRAALKWMDATMSCIDCHNFVRGIRVADRAAQ
ncbi:MAG: hypothetical protein U0992_13935 [Planctomycetaceae bacterium]